MTPPLHREPRRIRPPFDVAAPEPVDVTLPPGVSADDVQRRRSRHADRVAALLEALGDVEIGDHDMRIIEWLAGHNISTVGTVASLIHRARELGGAS